MKRNRIVVAVCATSILFSGIAIADDSEKETPQEEIELKLTELDLPDAVKQHIAYVEDLDRRYPDSGEVDTKLFMEEEGERFALSYCMAAGFDGPCTVDEKGGVSKYIGDVSIASKSDAGRSNWAHWVWNHLFNVGVIPEKNYCPAPYGWTQIYMDDEDRRNANSRWGWLGATVSNNNTAWRFCKLDTLTSINFRPLAAKGEAYSYAVLNMGVFCPSGGRRVWRFEDNEDWRNANSSSGSVFPSVNVFGRNWLMLSCHFDGGGSSWLGQMREFPDIGIHYGVFGAKNMPSPYALAHGEVGQDDEDNFNVNFWIGSPGNIMGGSRNTWRHLVKVK